LALKLILEETANDAGLWYLKVFLHLLVFNLVSRLLSHVHQLEGLSIRIPEDEAILWIWVALR
jgi:hypothetical protein